MQCVLISCGWTVGTKCSIVFEWFKSEVQRSDVKCRIIVTNKTVQNEDFAMIISSSDLQLLNFNSV